MNIDQNLNLILHQLSAGNALQNVAFYSCTFILVWMVHFQFRHPSGRFKTVEQ
jgi:hypothetical protein